MRIWRLSAQMLCICAPLTGSKAIGSNTKADHSPGHRDHIHSVEVGIVTDIETDGRVGIPANADVPVALEEKDWESRLIWSERKAHNCRAPADEREFAERESCYKLSMFEQRGRVFRWFQASSDDISQVLRPVFLACCCCRGFWACRVTQPRCRSSRGLWDL